MNTEPLNLTPFCAQAHLHPDAAGRDALLLVLKGSFDAATGRMLPIERQQPVLDMPQVCTLGQLALDELQRRCIEQVLAEEIVRLPSEIVPPKPLFDVLIPSCVLASDPGGAHVLAGQIDIDGRLVTVRGWSPHWQAESAGALRSGMARPVGAPVRQVPLVAEFAHWENGLFARPSAELARGGASWDEAKPARPVFLPWLDNPAGGLRCAAAWPESAPHRRPHAGTFDDIWKARRAPALPHDYDPRYTNCADPDLQLPQAPPPGAAVNLHNIGIAGRFGFRLPVLELAAEAAGRRVALRPDTLIIEPEAGRFTLRWCALLPKAWVGNEVVRIVRA